MQFEIPGTPQLPKAPKSEIHISTETEADRVKQECVLRIASLRKAAPEMPEIDEYLRPLILSGQLQLRPTDMIWQHIKNQIESEEGLVTPLGYVRFEIAELVCIPPEWYALIEAYRQAQRDLDVNIKKEIIERDRKLAALQPNMYTEMAKGVEEFL